MVIRQEGSLSCHMLDKEMFMKIRFLMLALALMLSAAPLAYAKSDNPFELNNATTEELMNRCFFSQEDRRISVHRGYCVSFGENYAPEIGGRRF